MRLFLLFPLLATAIESVEVDVKVVESHSQIGQGEDRQMRHYNYID